MYDRHNSPVYTLTESGVHMALYAYKKVTDDVTEEESFLPLTKDYGSYTIEQKYPCVEDDDACRDSNDPHQSRKFIFKSCQSERQAEFK